MGARGNSGVILSQIWRGFAKAVGDKDILDGPAFVEALAEARDVAYKGVVRPVEGTILTVAKDMASAAKEALDYTKDPYEILERVVNEAEESVERTPDLLDVLKDAGVVDSGGKGLFYIYEGMQRYLHSLPLDEALISVQPLGTMNLDNALEAIEPGQDFEVVIDFRPRDDFQLKPYYDHLEEIGTSIQVGEGDGIYRMHIHVPTENRYDPIDYTMSIGTITKVQIENLLAQMEEMEGGRKRQEIQLTAIEPGQIGVVAVVPGNGLARVFASLGAAAIVEGGQTMNPSTQEVTVKKVAVSPCRTVPQGLAAMLRLVPDGDMTYVVEEMEAALEEVETGEITTATRSVEIDGVGVEKGEIIALHNGKLVLSAKNLEDACLKFLELAEVDDYELITLFYGVDAPISDVDHIVEVIQSHYPDHEIEVQEGGQPHYQFIISIE